MNWQDPNGKNGNTCGLLLTRGRRYLQELRDLAARSSRISSGTLGKMRSKPVLLGMRHEKTMDSDVRKNTHSLWMPTEIVIVDDIQTYQLFDDLIIAAPRDMPPELEGEDKFQPYKNVLLIECNRVLCVTRVRTFDQSRSGAMPRVR